MRLIDVDTLPKLLDAEYKQTMKLIREGEKHLDTLAEGFTEAIHIAKYIAPTVDAVPVVRCKDCKYKGWVQEPCHGKSIDYCKAWDCTLQNLELTFCSYGERKEADHE